MSQEKSIKDYQAPDFDMDLLINRVENQDIIKTISVIQEEKKIYKYDELKLMHSDFANENPELFEKCVRTNMTKKDIEEMIFMLDMRKKIASGEMTHQQASSVVSVYFAKRYEPRLLEKGKGEKRW